ncbi:bucentaur or craniofacial development-domain-containing protein [Cercophora newfieldiana]|uniref:SWR1-complex protein 5 n=1 Tax=Cercophora newfieldiana TaxID=92897 RepID=A0AA40CP67_9PEZI|nr:bucentaur or craniofacial development-domain-containing protein [Cercophora newfieldiana]
MVPPDPDMDLEEDYASEEDSDFAPEDAPANESSPSDDEEEEGDSEKPTSGKRKRSAPEPEAEDAGFENSGDEAIIDKGKKRQKKPKGKTPAVGDEEENDGPLIKTRSMRAVEKAERRTAAASGPVTIDVDALWAQMISEPTVRGASTTQDGPHNAAPTSSQGDPSSTSPQQKKQTQPTTSIGPSEQSEFIKIKRTYNFAGKVHTEEKVVARDSAEARLYLASLGENGEAAEAADEDSAPKRIPKKAFRSMFEPIPDHSLLRTDLNLGMSVRLRARELANEANAKKLNTVEKSRMDWAGYVDKEGIKDELELAGKSKHSYAARQDFLARSEAIREDDARRVRLTGKT